MIPVWQTCPCCNTRFLGSDMIGFPCFECSGLDVIEPNVLAAALNQMYYQEEPTDDV
jgi:hypothetical protein